MDTMLFAFFAAPGPLETQAVLLLESIREFGGRFSGAPVWVLTPGSGDSLSPAVRAELESLGARVVPFDIDPGALDFVYGYKAVAATAAESLASGHGELLAWMDTDALLLQEPVAWLLPPEKQLGCRPVDITNVSSPAGQPADGFWTQIWRECGVQEGDVYPVIASVDRNRLRAHFNAGLLVVRPEKGLLGHWRDSFLRIYRKPEFARLYGENRLYKIFVHQAVFAATALAHLNRAEILELPHLASYTMLLHKRYPDEMRAVHLNDVVFCRIDGAFDNPRWREEIEIREPLHGWLARRLGAR